MSIKAFISFLLLSTLALAINTATVIAYYISGGATFRTMPNEIILLLALSAILLLSAKVVLVRAIIKNPKLIL